MSEDPAQYGEPRQEPTAAELADVLVWIARGLGKTEADALCTASVFIRKMDAELFDLSLRLENAVSHARMATAWLNWLRNADGETLSAMPDWSDMSIDAAMRKESETQ